MARRNQRGYRQYYSTNQIQATSAGRANQSEQTSKNGRYLGSRQGLKDPTTGRVSNSGQQMSREAYYRQLRQAFRDVAPNATRAIAEANGMSVSASGRGSLALSVG